MVPEKYYVKHAYVTLGVAVGMVDLKLELVGSGQGMYNRVRETGYVYVLSQQEIENLVRQSVNRALAGMSPLNWAKGG